MRGLVAGMLLSLVAAACGGGTAECLPLAQEEAEFLTGTSGSEGRAIRVDDQNYVVSLSSPSGEPFVLVHYATGPPDTEGWATGLWASWDEETQEALGHPLFTADGPVSDGDVEAVRECLTAPVDD